MEQNLSRVASRRIFYSFAGFIILLITLGLISILGINSLTKDLNKMYRTNVIPEHDGARLIKLQYENRYRLEEYITGMSHEKLPEIKSEIDRNNREIDSLGSYHLTADYFEPEKKQILKEFLSHHNNYKHIESKVVLLGVGLQHDTAVQLFSNEAYTEFKKSISKLDQLEESELNQGAIQLKETVAYANSLRVLEFITIMIAVVIAILIGTAVGRNLMDN